MILYDVFYYYRLCESTKAPLPLAIGPLLSGNLTTTPSEQLSLHLLTLLKVSLTILFLCCLMALGVIMCMS